MTSKPKFYRRTYNRYGKLGMKRKKKRVWRNPTGRHNKMREKRRGYTAVVMVGYKNKKSTQHTIEGKKLVLINNLMDLQKITKNEIAIIGKVGKKKKIEFAKKAKEMKIAVHNLNVEKFLKKLGKKNESN